MKMCNFCASWCVIRKWMVLTAVAVYCVLFVACQSESEVDEIVNIDREGVILGFGNTLSFVNVYEEQHGVSVEFVRDHKRPVGTITADPLQGLHEKFCSGTLIDDNLFLTAGHCYKSDIENMNVAFNWELEAGEGSPTYDEEFFAIKEVVDLQGITG